MSIDVLHLLVDMIALYSWGMAMDHWQVFAETMTSAKDRGRLDDRNAAIELLRRLMSNKRSLTEYVQHLADGTNIHDVTLEADDLAWIQRIAKSGLTSLPDDRLIRYACSKSILFSLFDAIERLVTTSREYSPWRQIYQEEFERLLTE